MCLAKQVIYLAAGVVLGVSQGAVAEEDSAYQWGRWAVLSPAAGGAEPYVGVDTPGADFNARPGDASEFQPELASVGLQPGPLLPPTVEPNPPGAQPPIGDGRVRSPAPVPNSPGSQPPIGDGRQR